MAIIQCPECKKNVSDTVSQCIHCGYKFKTCIECGSVISLNEKVCGNCGFNTEKTTNTQNIDIENSTTTNNQNFESYNKKTPTFESALSSCMATYPIGNLMKNNTLKIMDWISFALFLIIIIFALTINPNNFITNINIIGGIFIVDCLINIASSYFKELWHLGYHKTFSTYLDKNSINAKAIIEKELSADILSLNNKEKERLQDKLHLIIDAQIFTTNESLRITNLIVSLSYSSIKALTYIMWAIWGIINMTFLKEQFAIFGSEIPFAFQSLALIIVPSIIYITLIIFEVICSEFPNKTARMEWIKTNLPHKLKDYQTLKQTLKI